MDPLNWRCRTPIENDDIPASYVPKDPGSPNLRWWARGVFPSPPKRKVFRFHETILSFGEPGSLGVSLLEGTEAEAQAEAHGFSEWMVFGPIPWATEALDAPRRPGLQDGRASEGVICMERLGCFPSNTSIKDPYILYRCKPSIVILLLAKIEWPIRYVGSFESHQHCEVPIGEGYENGIFHYP